MAFFSKVSAASILTLLLLLCVIQADEQIESNKVSGSLPQDIDCDSACDVRCSKTSRLKECKRACGTCCARCHCVPPGTSGNEDACPCYANMTTHGGRHKCP